MGAKTGLKQGVSTPYFGWGAWGLPALILEPLRPTVASGFRRRVDTLDISSIRDTRTGRYARLPKVMMGPRLWMGVRQ